MEFDGIYSAKYLASLPPEERERLKGVVNLSHFRDERDRLVAVCRSCDFRKIVVPRTLRQRLGPHLRNATVVSLQRKLKCTNCGTVGESYFAWVEAEDE